MRSYAEELPTEEGQSNFDWSCTAPYAETADGLAVLHSHIQLAEDGIRLRRGNGPALFSLWRGLLLQ